MSKVLTVVKKGGSSLDESIYKSFILGQFAARLDKILTRYDKFPVHGIKNILTNYIYEKHGEPDFVDTSYIKKIGEKNLTAVLNLYNFLLKTYPNSNLSLEVNVMENCCFCWESPLVQPRKTLYPDVSELEIFRVNALYSSLKHISPGHQWTLYSDWEHSALRDEGFGIECFGSAFNSRFPYFGSLSVVDEPFGRLGTYAEILEKFANNEPIMYRGKVVECHKITVDPPSTKFLIFHSFELICEVLRKHAGPIEIIYNMPKYLYNEEFHAADQWLVAKRELGLAYDDTKRCITLKNREWLELRFSKK